MTGLDYEVWDDPVQKYVRILAVIAGKEFRKAPLQLRSVLSYIHDSRISLF
jgi:hypothetical protein